MEIIEEFLKSKGLEILSIKNPRNVTQSLAKEMALITQHGKVMSKVELINIKHLNTDQNFQTLCESILYLSELKYLNLSDNGFKPKQVGELVKCLNESETLKLLSLDISHNNMTPKQQRYFKNKKDKVGFMGDSEETLVFYDNLKGIINENCI